MTWARSLAFQIRYWWQRNHQQIQGQANQVIFATHSYLPRLQQVKMTMIGNHNTIVVEAGARLSQTQFLVQGCHNRIIIGADCTITDTCLWIEADHAQITLGQHTTIAQANIGVADNQAKITIGADCMLSHGIEIRCGDSHAVMDHTTGQRLNQAQYVTLESHVWLGMHTRVLKNVTIGHDAVIAAGAIVTRSLPSHCLAAGIPAQVKRENVTWHRDKNF